MKILGASIGNCVHVAGVYHFLQLAEQEGYECMFMGPAVSIEDVFAKIEEWQPDTVALGYRLTPENVVPLLNKVRDWTEKCSRPPVWVFGGTKPVADVAAKYGLFSFISDGFDDIGDAIRFLRGDDQKAGAESYGRTLVERIEKSYPYPVLRHHYGVPSMEETIRGIRHISEAKVLDVISLGPDQNAQQFLFRQDVMKKEFDGAGGVPIRSEEDFRKLKAASRRGNYPLMRCYSGTADVFEYADALHRTIDNAWTAVPLFWYNELDGRGTRPVEVSIDEAQRLIAWHAQRGIPVELNEPHHWGLRDAHDVIPVVAAYLAAYNAKKLGVSHYVAQYMFNNPSGVSFSMDYARILAMIDMVESLEDDCFTTYRQTRAGLPLFNADPDIAKGQLAASTFMQMNVRPHIIHVVGYCEADHAASASEVIESCKIVRGVIRHTMGENFSIEKDERIAERKEKLLAEANVFLDFVRNRYDSDPDPLASADVLADIVRKGYMDAAHIVKNDKFCGDLCTTFVDGACVAFDKETKEVLHESERLARLEEKNG
ncbi:MAG TPA: cobalamin B12-binding domain-containing protein [Clostridiales bacterium]|jgi:hypothetical protein|nr:cobalamin B12-binding domain-containing protein [Clostridiales bacterium]